MSGLEGKPREVKVVLLGDTGVGKSSLVLRFVTNNFKPYSESTIGASFMSKVVMAEGKQIKFQIWDTAGQEKYHSLARTFPSFLALLLCFRGIYVHKSVIDLFVLCVAMYYRGAAAAIVVYDITRASSFKTLRNWVDELRNQGPKDIALAIAGNKADLADRRVSRRTVCHVEDTEMAQSLFFICYRR
jgi:Ras-related protein Rab-22